MCWFFRESFLVLLSLYQGLQLVALRYLYFCLVTVVKFVIVTVMLSSSVYSWRCHTHSTHTQVFSTFSQLCYVEILFYEAEHRICLNDISTRFYNFLIFTFETWFSSFYRFWLYIREGKRSQSFFCIDGDSGEVIVELGPILECPVNSGSGWYLPRPVLVWLLCEHALWAAWLLALAKDSRVQGSLQWSYCGICLWDR